jgi:hypothetical protein
MVTVLVITPLLAIFHQIAAPHAVCEHGELVESGEVRLTPAGLESLDDGSGGGASTGTSSVRPDAESTAHGHRHCSVGTAARHDVGILPVTQVITVSARLALQGSPARSIVHVRTLLFGAPKTSPPRAAS